MFLWFPTRLGVSCLYKNCSGFITCLQSTTKTDRCYMPVGEATQPPRPHIRSLTDFFFFFFFSCQQCEKLEWSCCWIVCFSPTHAKIYPQKSPPLFLFGAYHQKLGGFKLPFRQGFGPGHFNMIYLAISSLLVGLFSERQKKRDT